MQTNTEEVSAEDAPSDLPVQGEPVSIEPPEQTLEPMQITAREEPTPQETAPATEPVPSEPVQQDAQVVRAPVSESTESSSSMERRPVERPRNTRKSHRKVPTYGESSVIVRMKLRTNFEFDCGLSELEKFEPIRALAQWISDLAAARSVPQLRQSFPVGGLEGQPVLRDISTTQAELSSIREQNQSRLFPIPERPQHEELAEQQLQQVSLPPVASAEPVEQPIAVPAVPPSPHLPEVSLGDANRALDTGLGNQSVFQATSASMTIPQVVITDTSIEDGSKLHRETPAGEPPAVEPIGRSQDAQAPPVVVSGQNLSGSNQPVPQTADDAAKATANNEVRVLG